MKDLLHVAAICLRLMPAQLFILMAAHAAQGVSSSGAGALDRGGNHLITHAENGDGSHHHLNSSGTRTTRSRSCPIIITKIRALTKTFGYIDDDNHCSLICSRQPNLWTGGTARSDLLLPRPAGRSP